MPPKALKIRVRVVAKVAPWLDKHGIIIAKTGDRTTIQWQVKFDAIDETAWIKTRDLDREIDPSNVIQNQSSSSQITAGGQGGDESSSDEDREPQEEVIEEDVDDDDDEPIAQSSSNTVRVKSADGIYEWTHGVHLAIDASSISINPRIQWPGGLGPMMHTPLEYFMKSFPTQLLRQFTNATNRGFPSDRRPVDESEMLKYLGLRLLMGIEKLSAEAAFRVQDNFDPGDPRIAADYQRRFKISFNRFKLITQFMSFESADGNDANDAWAHIRPLVDAFNQRRKDTVIPGDVLVVDESMSGWTGADGAWDAEGLPHVTKIIRKPVPVGCELKTLCCGKSKIMMQIEIMEGKETMQAKQHGGGGLGHVLRLVDHWKGTGRGVLGDSAFASVKACKSTNYYGLHFEGVIKTAYAGYPKKFIEAWYKDGESRHQTGKTMH